jgi:hypothetical protein
MEARFARGGRMNKGQEEAFEALWREYWGAGGRIEVDSVPVGGLDVVKAALSCLGDSEVDALFSDMRTLILIVEEIKKKASYKPSDIPTRNSKPTLHVRCGDLAWGTTWS